MTSPLCGDISGTFSYQPNPVLGIVETRTEPTLRFNLIRKLQSDLSKTSSQFINENFGKNALTRGIHPVIGVFCETLLKRPTLDRLTEKIINRSLNAERKELSRYVEGFIPHNPVGNFLTELIDSQRVHFSNGRLNHVTHFQKRITPESNFDHFSFSVIPEMKISGNNLERNVRVRFTYRDFDVTMHRREIRFHFGTKHFDLQAKFRADKWGLNIRLPL